MGLTVAVGSLLSEASEIHDFFFGMNIQVVDARAKVIHKLSQSSGRGGPIVHGLSIVEFSMHWRADLERQTVLGGNSLQGK